jgi:hypothetical protein
MRYDPDTGFAGGVQIMRPNGSRERIDHSLPLRAARSAVKCDLCEKWYRSDECPDCDKDTGAKGGDEE